MAQVMCWLGWLADCVEGGETLKTQRREEERDKLIAKAENGKLRNSEMGRRSDFVRQQRQQDVEAKGMMNRWWRRWVLWWWGEEEDVWRG